MVGQEKPDVLESLDERGQKRLSGKAWHDIRPVVDQVHRALTEVSDEVSGELTTIYIKYTSANTCGNPFAILWVKKSTEIILGLAMPEPIPVELSAAPAKNMIYNGITGYLKMAKDDLVPAELSEWAIAAYKNTIASL